MRTMLNKKLFAFIIVIVSFTIVSAQPPNLKLSIHNNEPIRNFRIRNRETSNDLLPTNNSLSNSNQIVLDSTDMFILHAMNKYHLPGLAATIIKNGKIALTKSYGYANI